MHLAAYIVSVLLSDCLNYCLHPPIYPRDSNCPLVGVLFFFFSPCLSLSPLTVNLSRFLFLFSCVSVPPWLSACFSPQVGRVDCQTDSDLCQSLYIHQPCVAVFKGLGVNDFEIYHGQYLRGAVRFAATHSASRPYEHRRSVGVWCALSRVLQLKGELLNFSLEADGTRTSGRHRNRVTIIQVIKARIIFFSPKVLPAQDELKCCILPQLIKPLPTTESLIQYKTTAGDTVLIYLI